MPRKRRRFSRPLGEKRYRKLFVVSVEGTKTEPMYFAILQNASSVIHVNCLKGSRNSAPGQVLKRMQRYLRQQGLRGSDEAWLVVDRDQWTDTQLAELYAWSQRAGNHGFALRNPKFEYWLLLHFEEGVGVGSSRECTERLRRHLPDYDKAINARQITQERIGDAIRRAKGRDTPPCPDWPRTTGSTTVYRLVQRIVG